MDTVCTRIRESLKKVAVSLSSSYWIKREVISDEPWLRLSKKKKEIWAEMGKKVRAEQNRQAENGLIHFKGLIGKVNIKQEPEDYEE